MIRSANSAPPRDPILVRWLNFSPEEVVSRVKRLTSGQASVLFQIIKIGDCDCPLVPMPCQCQPDYNHDVDEWVQPDPEDCRCPKFFPCSHSNQNSQSKSGWSWQEEKAHTNLVCLLQAHLWPEIYAERPAPFCRSNARIKSAQVEVMAERHAAGRSLWHEGDWLRTHPRQLERTGRMIVGHVANGHIITGLLCNEVEHDEDKIEQIPEDFICQELAVWRGKNQIPTLVRKAG